MYLDSATRTKVEETGGANFIFITKDGKLVTAGGRVLAITVNGEGIEKQRETIYAEIDKIEYEGKYFRRDVGLDLLNYKG